MFFELNIAIEKATKNINFIYNHLFCCNHTCYCVGMVSVTSVSRYVTSARRYHVDPWSDSTELAEAVPIEFVLMSLPHELACD